MRAVISCVVLGSVLAAAAAPRVAAGADDRSYIKVEAKGRFHFPPPKALPNDRPTITVGREEYQLDLTNACDARKVEKLRKLDGETIIVEGRLELRRGAAAPVIVVAVIRAADGK